MFAFGAVHFVASDITVFGAYPRFMLYNLLLPVGFDSERIFKISSLISKYARDINVFIAGGHTGAYYGIKIPIAASFMIGFLINNKPVLPSGARPGDRIIITKWLGLEFMVSLYYHNIELMEQIIGANSARKYRDLYKLETVVNEATLLTKENLVNAMHDVTEGGLATALNELADSSNLGFEFYYEYLPINEETFKIFQHLNINPLHVSSTGCLIAAIHKEHVNDVLKLLKKNDISAEIVGLFTKEKRRKIVYDDNRVEQFPRDEKDAYAAFFK